MNNIREMLEDNIRNEIKDKKEIALSFSGGTDSTCLLLSLLSMGIFPHLYTYAVGETPDLDRAKMVSKMFNLPLTICAIDESRLIDDVRRIIGDGIVGKVCIQCMHGHYYVAPQVKEAVILNGSGIDGIYGSYKSMAIYGRNDRDKFDEMRQEHLEAPNDDAMMYQSSTQKRRGWEYLLQVRWIRA
jgi:asparagine synthetase B (glutamine-hydrolysing)